MVENKTKIKICFIILHYNLITITKRCINSLLKLEDINDCKIIIYDNGSKNESGTKLLNKYKKNSLVDVLISKCNKGFSRGNNDAYNYIKSKYVADYIITLNNDVIVNQKQFIKKLYVINQDNLLYLIGPDIYCPTTHFHQNPLYSVFPQRDLVYHEYVTLQKEKIININKSTKIWEKRILKNKILLHVPNFIISFIRTIKKKLGKYSNPEWKKLQSYKLKQTNAVLQGSCLIFTNKFIKDNDVLFEPETFFYFEELLLSLKCETKHYLVLYTPELRVLHYHGISTNKACTNAKNIIITSANRTIDSYNIFEKTIKDNPWKNNDQNKKN